MSHAITLNAQCCPPWVNNAWKHADNLRALGQNSLEAWNKTHNSVIVLETPNSECAWTITFPSEKDYVMFVLRWS